MIDEFDKLISAQAAMKFLDMDVRTFKKSLVPFVKRFENAKPKYTKRLLKLWLEQKTVSPEVASTNVRVRHSGGTITQLINYEKVRERLTGQPQRHL